MSNFKVISKGQTSGDFVQIDELAELLVGSSIMRVSLVDDMFRIALSNGLELSLDAVSRRKMEVVASIDSDSQWQESVRIRLLDENEESTALLVESRLRAVRQIYAMAVVLQNEETAQEFVNVFANDQLDFESVLDPGDRLIIVGAGQGSFLVDLAMKAWEAAKKAPQSALNLLSLIFPEGRTQLLERVKAGTRIMQAEAAIKEAEAGIKEAEVAIKRAEASVSETEVSIKKYEAAQKAIETAKMRNDGIVEMSNKISKIKDAKARKLMHDAFLKGLRAAVSEDQFRKLLPNVS